MKILFITEDYPDKKRSTFVFVKQLVEEIAKRENECYVIAPHSITSTRRIVHYKEIMEIDRGRVEVYRPNYFSTSTLKIGGFLLQRFLHKRAVLRAIKSLNVKVDAVYCHFWTSAYEVLDYVVSKQIPLFVASGESKITEIPDERDRILLRKCVSGVICVSTKNKEESVSLALTIPEKCVVIPNAVNLSLFRVVDRSSCRRELLFSENDYIISFLGWFNERKGSKRVAEAIKRIPGNTVKSIFIGRGPDVPDCSDILFCGSLTHEDIPKFLNAADVFVLPTRKEGCCNAIIEAMACGLPVISSDCSFNYDILDESNAILCDPDDVGALAEAITKLRDDKELRKRLSKGAYEKAQHLSLSNRAMLIESFIKENLPKHD